MQRDRGAALKLFTKQLSTQERSLLKKLIGQEFRFIGGPFVPDFLVSDHFIIATPSFGLTVHGDIHDSPFGETLLDYSHFVVRKAECREIEATLASGNVFLEQCRSQITEVLLVRETISYKYMSIWRRSYQSDVAIALRLVQGYVVLRLLSHSVEAISAEMLAEFDLSSFESPSNAIQPKRFESYQSQFSLFSI
jgi:hypothetical protein